MGRKSADERGKLGRDKLAGRLFPHPEVEEDEEEEEVLYRLRFQIVLLHKVSPRGNFRLSSLPLVDSSSSSDSQESCFNFFRRPTDQPDEIESIIAFPITQANFALGFESGQSAICPLSGQSRAEKSC